MSMPGKQRFTAVAVVREIKLCHDICTMVLDCHDVSRAAGAGQFVMVKTAEDNSNDPLLRRPFSIHRVTGDLLTLIFKVVGRGTEQLARRKKGDTLHLIGPLGNGFAVVPGKGVHHLLVGGGMGIAPLQFLAETIRRQHPRQAITALIGARNLPELDSFNALHGLTAVTVRSATDDGSAGHHGFVTDLLDDALTASAKTQVYCCGPRPMMTRVAAICSAHGAPCQVSLEAHMACGIGACLGCAISKGDETGAYLHVCMEGPVFPAATIWP